MGFGIPTFCTLADTCRNGCSITCAQSRHRARTAHHVHGTCCRPKITPLVRIPCLPCPFVLRPGASCCCSCVSLLMDEAVAVSALSLDCPDTLSGRAVACWDGWQAKGREKFFYQTELFADVAVHMLTLVHHLHVWLLHGMSFHLLDALLLLDTRVVVMSLLQRLRAHMSHRWVHGSTWGGVDAPMPVQREPHACQDGRGSWRVSSVLSIVRFACGQGCFLVWCMKGVFVDVLGMCSHSAVPCCVVLCCAVLTGLPPTASTSPSLMQLRSSSWLMAQSVPYAATSSQQQSSCPAATCSTCPACARGCSRAATTTSAAPYAAGPSVCRRQGCRVRLGQERRSQACWDSSDGIQQDRALQE